MWAFTTLKKRKKKESLVINKPAYNDCTCMYDTNKNPSCVLYFHLFKF